jgi:hypothetical protein
MVIAPDVLVQIALKMPSGRGMMSSADPALHQGPEPLDGLSVNVALDVDPSLMVNPFVLVAEEGSDFV